MTRQLTILALVALLAAPAAAQVPKMRETVDAVFASAKWNLGTKPENGCFTEAVAYALHKRDPNWGHLRKFRETWWNGHAADAVLHKSGYAVDIIGHSDDPAEAKPAWTVDKPSSGQPRYPDAAKYFVVPTASCSPDEPDPGTVDPTPVPNPPPPTEDLKALLEERFGNYRIQNVMSALDELMDRLDELHLKVDGIDGQAGELGEQLRTMTFPCFTATSRVLGQVKLCPEK